MDARRYRRLLFRGLFWIFAATAAAVIGYLVFVSGCRGDDCGWLLAGILLWLYVLSGLILLAFILVFLVCSGFRFRDLGLPAFLTVVPAILLLGMFTLVRTLFSAPEFLLHFRFIILNVPAILCSALCVYCLFFLRTRHFAQSYDRKGDLASNVLTISAVVVALLSIPYVARRVTELVPFSNGRSPEWVDALLSLTFRNPWIGYVSLFALILFTWALWTLMRKGSEPGNAASTTV